MDDAFVVRVLQGGANLGDQFQRLARLDGLGLLSSCRRFIPSTYSMMK